MVNHAQDSTFLKFEAFMMNKLHPIIDPWSSSNFKESNNSTQFLQYLVKSLKLTIDTPLHCSLP